METQEIRNGKAEEQVKHNKDFLEHLLYLTTDDLKPHNPQSNISQYYFLIPLTDRDIIGNIYTGRLRINF